MDSGTNFIDDKSLINPVSGTGGGNLSNMSVELCLVCGDRASGRHYGAISCEGCKGFFKRSIRKQLGYQCRGTMNCEVTKHHRNRCQFCRLQKCLASGMRSDSVQHERKPIIDKKELHGSISNAAANTNNTGAVMYHHRNKTSYNHQNSSAASNAALTSENLTAVFPVGFNFTDLTSLSKRALLVAAPYQQQSMGQSSDNFSCSPGTQTNDDDSMDNSASGVPNHSLNNATSMGVDSLPPSSTSASVTAAAVSLIQSSIDKHMLTQSMDLMASIKQQYESSSINSNSNNNNIVKDELIIDNQNDMNDTEDESEKIIFEVPILPEGNVQFNLQTPCIVPAYLNLHYVCECGSRLLFLSVYWVKKIHAFQQLPEEIQIKLLRRHWVKLFAIGLSQCSRLLSMSTIMTTLVSNVIQTSETERVSVNEIRKLSEHAYNLNQFVQSMQNLNVNEYEYAYLRLIVVFNAGFATAKDRLKHKFVEKLQDYALTSFVNYLHETNDTGPHTRSNRILTSLIDLYTLDSSIIEELFFSNLIGQVQIDNMIPYILKLGGGGI